jgi:SCY1-like protein 1
MLTPFFFIVEVILDRTTLATHNIGKMIGILYKVNDRAIRGTLLQKASYMADHLDKNTLNDAVFEPMCGGFSDSSAALRELTLKATAFLVPHLSHPNLEKLSRYLVRLQSDPESSIRTNTVIFFSKLAPYLTEVTRHKILLPAFVRAMKDPFNPCRLAALRSTVKAKTFFDAMGIASRVLPAITPQLLDPSGEVRREAFTAVDDLLFVLRQESERLSTLPEQVLMNPNIPVINGAPIPTTGVVTNPLPPQSISTTPAPNTAAAPTSGGFTLGGISSWMSSSKATTGTGATPTTTAPVAMSQPVPPPPPPAHTVYPPQVPQQYQASQPSVQYAVPTPAMQQMNFNSGTNNDDHWDDVDDDEGAGDGWGDDDDEDLDVSIPKATSTQQQSHNEMKPGTRVQVAPLGAPSKVTGSSTLFTASNDDDDDFFGGFDDKPAKSIVRPKTTTASGSSGMGKLVVPVKKTLGGGKLSTTPKPVIKKLTTSNATSSTATKDDTSDNWDDF